MTGPESPSGHSRVHGAVRRLSRGLAALIFCWALLYHATARFDLPKHLFDFTTEPGMAWLMVAILLASVVAVGAPLRQPANGGASRHDGTSRHGLPIGILAVAALALVAPITFVIKYFGQGDLESILYAASENSPADLAAVAFSDFSGPLAKSVAIAAVLIVAVLWLWRSMPAFPPVLAGISAAAIVTSMPAAYIRDRIWPDPARDLVSTADIRPPLITAEPAIPPNLVLIYLESLERSYRDIPATADAFAPLAAIEDAGFSARNVSQIHGTHFSAAGLVATQCGVPLAPRGLADPQNVKTTADATRLGVTDFMPGITCLGDVLHAHGYAGSYLNGSDTAIFSIDNFMRGHGYDRIRGLRTEPEVTAHLDLNTWGVPDTVLFDQARDELAHLTDKGQPFFL